MAQRTRPELEGRETEPQDVPLLEEALAAEGLPPAEPLESGTLFFSFRDRAGALVGFAGLEPLGDVALLRSVIVLPPARAQAAGSAIVTWMLEEAQRRGVGSLYLLTTGAAGFFEKLGFAGIDRKSVPPAIAATGEFKNLCPADATVMCRALPKPRGDGGR